MYGAARVLIQNDTCSQNPTALNMPIACIDHDDGRSMIFTSCAAIMDLLSVGCCVAIVITHNITLCDIAADDVCVPPLTPSLPMVPHSAVQQNLFNMMQFC